jgi:hypothetical protein
MTCGSCGADLAGTHGNRRYCSDQCKHREDSRRRLGRVRAARQASGPALPDVPAADLGWLAGIIDGEGSIALSHGGNGTPHLRVQITNGSQPILAKVAAVYRAAGLRPYINHERRAVANVSVTQQDTLVLHALLRPYLVRQGEQYDAAATFLRRRYDEGRRRVYWTEEERAEWEALRTKFHRRASSNKGAPR